MGIWYSRILVGAICIFNQTAGCNDDCKSTSRGIQFLGDKLVSWSSKKQDCTAMSTAKDDMSVVYVLTTLIPEDGGDDATMEQIRKRAKGLILNGMSNSLFDIYQNVESSKELWNSLEAKYMAEDASSKKFLVSNFINYKMTDSRPVLEQYDKLLGILGRFTQHKMNMDEAIQLGSHLRIKESLRVQDSDKPKGNNVVSPSVVNIKCGKTGYIKRDCKGVNVGNKANGSGIKGSVDGSSNSLKGQNMFNKSLQVYYVTYVSEAYFVEDDDVAWWVDSGATIHVCKDRSFMSTSKLNDSILWHARLGHVHFKRMQDMSKDRLILDFDMDTKNDLCDLHATPSLRNKKYSVTFIDDASRTDRGCEYMDTLYFQSVGIIHETTAPYTSQQNGISERKNKVLKEMVNSMLSYSGLSQGFWGEAMLTTCYLLNRVPNKRNMITPYELWTKRKPNLNYLRVWGCRAVVRLPNPKLKTLGERGIECIFVGYAEHSKAFRFYVIEPNESVLINSIIESRDADDIK
ncbi:zinc finger, CCHC-type containing protein [Tanacetum coccineum]|uniref:Zinc finger, CCHC-type containing protein n=1 Tax=Tanacetum coccineum TaxID=301880 RepID=A0ABQ5CCY6_9ASTR